MILYKLIETFGTAYTMIAFGFFCLFCIGFPLVVGIFFVKDLTRNITRNGDDER